MLTGYLVYCLVYLLYYRKKETNHETILFDEILR